MFRYRPDQGIYARGTTFWALTLLAGLGGVRFHYWVQRWHWADHELTEAVPVLGFPITPGFLVALLFFGILTYVVWRVINRERLANLLIDTEQEMKKVTWPSFDDSKKASLVVIGCVIFMLVFLGVADFLLEIFFGRLVY